MIDLGPVSESIRQLINRTIDINRNLMAIRVLSKFASNRKFRNSLWNGLLINIKLKGKFSSGLEGAL